MRRLFGRRARKRDEEDVTENPDQQPGDELSALDRDDAGEYGTDEFEAFVPVGREYESYEAYADEMSDDETPDAARDTAAPYAADDVDVPEDAYVRPRRRIRMPRPRLPRFDSLNAVRWDVLLLTVLLIAAGVFGTLLVQDRLSGDIVTLWPLALVVVAVVWLVVALVRRHVTSFLGAAAFAGVGLSLLMDAQAIAQVEETLLGVVLVTIGLGIVMRGFLLRQRNLT